jgi:hypothetical protein
MDLFTVSHGHLRGALLLFPISHDRRRILHGNVTRHATRLWIVQQLREAFPFDLLGFCFSIGTPSTGRKSPLPAFWQAAEK